VLPSELARDPSRKARLEREAKGISQLNHAHICTLHDIGAYDGIDYLVMEYIEGETLADRLKRGAIFLEQALELARQMASALAAAHEHGIVHRDLKPSNVMLTKSGVKLLDFGLAK
jgi:serine/threonine protein kinase